MQDLAEFMKGLLQRFSQWFNRAHSRTGTLWEDRIKSVIMEDGVAARTISAYIALNPVRAGFEESDLISLSEYHHLPCATDRLEQG